MSEDLYRCDNDACQIGGVHNPGFFTGGLTLAGMVSLTGKPAESAEEGVDFGVGVCPNCGTPGEATGEEHSSLKGKDPYAKLHAQIAARVEDPDDSLTARGAQAALEAAIKEDDDAA